MHILYLGYFNTFSNKIFQRAESEIIQDVKSTDAWLESVTDNTQSIFQMLVIVY